MDLLRETLLELRQYILDSKQKMKEEEGEDTEKADWRFMAMVGMMFSV
jgi:hypothetical protein